MNLSCEMIKDLLPLYAEGMCSADSTAYVEAHLAACPGCRQLLEDIKTEALPQEVRIPREEVVLSGATWQISKGAAACAGGITAIILYWLIYLWQDALASQGNYRYFSYSFHEAYMLGYLLVPLLTALWLGTVLVGRFRRKGWRKHPLLPAVLALLLVLQVGVLFHNSDTVHTDSWTQVLAIPDAYHIVLPHNDGTITLEAPPMVTRLLKTDGTIYGFSFESSRRDPTRGVLNGVWPAED